MGKTLVITSGKGGVGKTTSTANIGVALSKLGKKTVVIDADIGLRNLDVILGLENRIVYTIIDIVENRCRIKQALIKDKRYDGLYLLPACQTKDKTAIRPTQMRKVCKELENTFDYVIVDSPAGIEQGFQNAIAGANDAIVVTTPEVSAVRDADRIISLLDVNGIENTKLIINRVKEDMMKKGQMMDTNDILDILGIELIGIVPDEKEIVVSSNRGEPVAGREDSITGQAYMDIARRINGEDVPIRNIVKKENLMKRLVHSLGF